MSTVALVVWQVCLQDNIRVSTCSSGVFSETKLNTWTSKCCSCFCCVCDGHQDSDGKKQCLKIVDFKISFLTILTQLAFFLNFSIFVYFNTSNPHIHPTSYYSKQVFASLNPFTKTASDVVGVGCGDGRITSG